MDVFLDAIRQAFGLLLSGDPYLWKIIGRSLQVSSSAVLLGLLIGIPLGTWLALARFPGRGIAVALVNTGLALPPVVVGLFVYILLSRQGPLGGLGWLYTPSAMVAAQFVLAAPYVAAITLAAVQSVPPELRLQARALGAGRWGALLLHLREARLSLMAAVAAGFGAVMAATCTAKRGSSPRRSCSRRGAAASPRRWRWGSYSWPSPSPPTRSSPGSNRRRRAGGGR
jgi:tungstate transport system permease protein